MKTKRTASPTPAESTAVRIGGRALQVASEQAITNGMTLRHTVETIILAWSHTTASGPQGIGAAVVAKVASGQAPIDAAVEAIREKLPFKVITTRKNRVGKPTGAPVKKGGAK